MDGSVAGSGFQIQFQQFIFYAGSIVQLLYYVAMPAVAVMAYLQFKRWVDAQVPAVEKPAALAEDASVSVDEFVE
ncbi:MAG: hypothetical protein C0418_05585 [Coriobacteriaceae bacterium]|nr:hypothetical protein [Coriobacteriaceae bacterium]